MLSRKNILKLIKLPKIVTCKELPQWIVESDRAAYHPASNTIYIRNDQNLFILFHEFLHFFFHQLGFTFNSKIHKLIDKYLTLK
jgi:hypothetical protein